MPANDQGLPPGWRQRRKKKEPIAAMAAAALLLIVSLSIVAAWRDAPSSARVDAPGPKETAAEVAPTVMLLPNAPEPSAPSAHKERARALVSQAIDAVLADQLPRAEALLRAAWQIEKTYDIAGNLGHVELTNGKPRDAAEHLRFSLEALPPSETSAQRDRVKSRFDEARKLVAALRISVDAPGAEVSVDGVPVGIAPVAGEVFVDPGDRVVTARLAGFDADPVIVAARAGAAYEVTLRHLPEAPTVAELPPRSAPGNAAPPAAAAAEPATATTSPLVEAPPRAPTTGPHRRRQRPAEPAPSASVSPEIAELRALYQYATPPDAER
jgi:hypothetical protein